MSLSLAAATPPSPPLIIAIGGASGCGKTTLASFLHFYLSTSPDASARTHISTNTDASTYANAGAEGKVEKDDGRDGAIQTLPLFHLDRYFVRERAIDFNCKSGLVCRDIERPCCLDYPQLVKELQGFKNRYNHHIDNSNKNKGIFKKDGDSDKNGNTDSNSKGKGAKDSNGSNDPADTGASNNGSDGHRHSNTTHSHSRSRASTAASSPPFILLEGFLLFNYPPLLQLVDHCFFISIPRRVGLLRRYGRDRDRGEEPNENFKSFYHELVWPRFLQYNKHVYEADQLAQSIVTRGLGASGKEGNDATSSDGDENDDRIVGDAKQEMDSEPTAELRGLIDEKIRANTLTYLNGEDSPYALIRIILATIMHAYFLSSSSASSPTPLFSTETHQHFLQRYEEFLSRQPSETTMNDPLSSPSATLASATTSSTSSSSSSISPPPLAYDRYFGVLLSAREREVLYRESCENEYWSPVVYKERSLSDVEAGKAALLPGGKGPFVNPPLRSLCDLLLIKSHADPWAHLKKQGKRKGAGKYRKLPAHAKGNLIGV